MMFKIITFFIITLFVGLAFYSHVFVLLSYFFWLLYCLSFDFDFLITLLESSNISLHKSSQTNAFRFWIMMVLQNVSFDILFLTATLNCAIEFKFHHYKQHIVIPCRPNVSVLCTRMFIQQTSKLIFLQQKSHEWRRISPII